VPNVGKSTLINTLTGRKAAKTGDEAGITKAEQRITLADDFYLYDTPGMLWPRITVAQSGYFLAASGAVGRNAYDDEEVALELLAVLKRRYPALLEARFRLSGVAAMADEDLLAEVGRQRGALQKDEGHEARQQGHDQPRGQPQVSSALAQYHTSFFLCAGGAAARANLIPPASHPGLLRPRPGWNPTRARPGQPPASAAAQ